MSSFLGGFLGGLGGGAIGRAAVELVLDSTQYQAQLAETEGKTAAATGEMQATTSKMSGVATAAYAAAGIAAVEFGKASVEAAIGLNEATDKLSNSIANSAKVSADSQQAFIDQADAIAHLTGVANDQIITGQSLLVQMGLTADQVTQLTPLVVDLAAKNNVDLNSAFKAVGKAAEGSTGALARYVGPVQKGATASQTFANVTTKLSANLGIAAQRANAEPWRLLSETIHELEQRVGGELIPLLKEGAVAFEDLAKVVSPLVAEAFQVAGEQAKPLIDALQELANVQLPAAAQGQSQLAKSAGEAAHMWGEVIKFNPISILTKYNSVILQHLGLMHQDTVATDAAGTSAGRTAQQEKALADAHHNAAQAARDQKQAEQELAGGFVGLLASLEQLRTDQAALNKLKAQGKQGTQDYANAVQAELQDQLSYSSAIQDLANKMKTAGASTQDVKDKVIQLGREAGLTKGDIQALLASVSSGAKNAKDNITGIGNAFDDLRHRASAPIDIRFRLTAENLTGLPSNELVQAIIRAQLIRNSG